MAKTALLEPGATGTPHPLTPSVWRVAGRKVETADVVTLSLSREPAAPFDFRHGQFNMLTALGVGEAAISISSSPGAAGPIEHSIRDVGAVTHALCNLPVGGAVGVRGPFGKGWDVEAQLAAGRTDVVVVAGGIGLAPLRSAVRDLVERQQRGEVRLFVLVGARSPDQIVFAEDVAAWRAAAARARDAGFDIVEVHCAHGYLNHQFLSPLVNARNDAYGGDRAGRMRFPLEVAEAVRAEWPADKPVFVRISAVDGLDGGWELADSVAVCGELAACTTDSEKLAGAWPWFSTTIVPSPL